jgi:hypothetical protein
MRGKQFLKKLIFGRLEWTYGAKFGNGRHYVFSGMVTDTLRLTNLGPEGSLSKFAGTDRVDITLPPVVTA